ncbi:hypothetical protein [Candidatus Enterovibrio escicola]|uniref:Uncharacterized protein n=3 Tax=Candidatus Enterovibrio escicola TaxID=1927127 RepID=A0A2A5T4C8_9GAMM|nr:hypothetical protein [Candidatus Enterovibrio escacola]PCS23013.1 hypothetical protein BTN49_1341 [Candidatus Enterovibrio escacola]
MRRHRTSRIHELAHHTTVVESMDSQLCKLHIKVLSAGVIPSGLRKSFIKVKALRDDYRSLSSMTGIEQQQAEFCLDYLQTFGMSDLAGMSDGIHWLTHYQKRILLALCDFIDDPLRCHRGLLAPLHQCKSLLKTLQTKQRVHLIKVVTVLISSMNIESWTIGKYSNKYQSALYDNNGLELFRGITHAELKEKYRTLWGQDINKGVYDDCIKMLKLAGFLEIESCYLSNDAGDIKRQELRESGASLDEINAIPRICSEAAFKRFTPAFKQVFAFMLDAEDMIKSKMKAFAKSAARKLSSAYATYSPFSDSFWTRKRNDFKQWKNGRSKYPQSASMMSACGDPIPIN